MATREEWVHDAERVAEGFAELVFGVIKFIGSAAIFLVVAGAVLGLIVFALRQL